MQFRRKSAPKKLSIRNIYRLFKSLKDGISKEPERFLIDEMISLMKKIDVESFKNSLRIMYGRDDFDNPLEVALLFSKGIKKANLFHFVKFVESISGRTK